jgi:hypothetical protein
VPKKNPALTGGVSRQKMQRICSDAAMIVAQGRLTLPKGDTRGAPAGSGRIYLLTDNLRPVFID